MLNLSLARGLLQGGHPVWMCGMRPFFAATAACAVALMLPWLLYLDAGMPVPASAGGPTAWHAHELLFGFALASVLGFLLTAVPEFTGTPEFAPATVRRLALLWLAGRLAFWAGATGGLAWVLLSGLLHLALFGALVLVLAPRLWSPRGRAHRSFLWALVGLSACSAGFHVELLLGAAAPARWLHASVGVYMTLVVVALSRISMRIVNEALDARGQRTSYVARPPRRNLAVFGIGLVTLVELVLPGTRLAGWLALAAAAAIFHLMNDWHVGRALFRRRPLMLYAVYVCMGLGYLLMGVGLLFDAGSISGGRHVLSVGALGLAILAAMSIAGRAHCGLPPDEGAWLPLAAASLVLAAGLRGAAGWLLPDPAWAWSLAGALWCLAFGLYAWRMVPLLLMPRGDGRRGCHGPEDPPA